MAVETNVEREFKFDVDPDFEPPDLRPVVGRTERLPEQHLTTTYLDTPDRRLWARGITLRHRLVAEGDGLPQQPGKWTLKLPLDPAADEDRMARSELSWTGSLEDTPEEAAAILAGVVRRARLETVVELSSQRRRLLLHGAQQPWAEVDDDLATVTSGGRQGLRFRQLELELLAEDGQDAPYREELDAVLGELRRAGAAPGGGSKLALAAGLDDPWEDTGRQAGDIRSFVSRTLSLDLGLLLECDYRLRVSNGDGDSAAPTASLVHAAGAAAGRLARDLRVFGAVLDPVWANHLRADLEWLSGLTERLEEEDLLVDRVQSCLDDGMIGGGDPQIAHDLAALLRSDRHLGATVLADALASERYIDLLDRLNAGVREPPLLEVDGHASIEEVLRSTVAASWRSVRAEIDGLGSRPDLEALAHLCVLSGLLAHAAAMAEPYLGKKAARTASAASKLHSVLQDVRRSDHAARALAEIASHPALTSPVAFLAGLVAGRSEVEVERGRDHWRKAAKKLAKAGKASWRK